jgi:hypothetical protein
MVTLMAWESTNYAWNSFAHSFGAFVTSSGFAGAAAVSAAGLAAWQVHKTRKQDRLQYDLESVQKRFEWVADRSTAPPGQRAVLSKPQKAAMLRLIRHRAESLGDDLLTDMIREYRDDNLDALLGEAAPTRQS